MLLRVQSLSPFCRKTVAAIRLRRDPVHIAESGSPFEPGCQSLGTLPMLVTDEGSFTTPSSVLAWLEARGPQLCRLVPPDRIVEVTELDRLVDLYLLEPAITMIEAPGSDACARAQCTVLRSLDLLVDRLSDGRAFVMGPDLTLVDVTALIGITDVARRGVAIPDSLAGWLHRVRMRQPLDAIVHEADAIFGLRESGPASIELAA